VIANIRIVGTINHAEVSVQIFEDGWNGDGVCVGAVIGPKYSSFAGRSRDESRQDKKTLVTNSAAFCSIAAFRSSGREATCPFVSEQRKMETLHALAILRHAGLPLLLTGNMADKRTTNGGDAGTGRSRVSVTFMVQKRMLDK